MRLSLRRAAGLNRTHVSPTLAGKNVNLHITLRLCSASQREKDKELKQEKGKREGPNLKAGTLLGEDFGGKNLINAATIIYFF